MGVTLQPGFDAGAKATLGSIQGGFDPGAIILAGGATIVQTLNDINVVIADVAGKGIAASLLVNTLNASLYAYLDNKTPLPEMADKLNKIIYNASHPDKFITYFITILDAKTGELDIVNAGHNPIL